MRIAVEDLRRVKLDAGERLVHPCLALGTGRRNAAKPQGKVQRMGNPIERIERLEGILENRLHVTPEVAEYRG